MASRKLRAHTRRDYKLLHEGLSDKEISSHSDSSAHSEPESQGDTLPEFFHAHSGLSPRSRRAHDAPRQVSDSSDDDIVSLHNKEASIDGQIARLQAKDRIQAKEAKLAILQGASSRAPKHSSSSRSKSRLPSNKTRPALASAAAVTLQHLRRHKVAKAATSSLKKLSLGMASDTDDSSSDPDSSNDSDSSIDESDVFSHRAKRRLGKVKSGRVAKTHDIVVTPLNWPHTFLRYGHAGKDTVFENLDMPLLVAGELEILKSPSTNKVEKAGRAELLQSLMYNSKIYTWANCLEYFGAILSFIEKGGAWSNSVAFANIQQNTLIHKKLSRSLPSGTGTLTQTAGVKSPQTWYCRSYQSNECSLPEGHEQDFRGKTHKASHICSFCYQTRKLKLKHSERDCSAAKSSGNSKIHANNA